LKMVGINKKCYYILAHYTKKIKGESERRNMKNKLKRTTKGATRG